MEGWDEQFKHFARVFRQTGQQAGDIFTHLQRHFLCGVSSPLEGWLSQEQARRPRDQPAFPHDFFFFNKNTFFVLEHDFQVHPHNASGLVHVPLFAQWVNLCKQLAIAISGVTKPLPNINNISNINNVNVTPTPASSSCFPLFFSANDSNCSFLLGFCHQRLSWCIKMTFFSPLWTILDIFGPSWAFWTTLAQRLLGFFGKKKQDAIYDPKGPKWPKKRPQWSKLSKRTQSGPKGPKQSIGAHNWPKGLRAQSGPKFSYRPKSDKDD